MKRYSNILILAGAYVLVLLAMFILPFYSVPEYSILSNTLNQLGAQFTTNAWIMNFIFISLGIGSVTAGWTYYKEFVFHRIYLIIFGASLVFTAFFHHAPLRPEIQYNIIEDGWHSYFACTTPISLTVLTITTSYFLKKKSDKMLGFSTGISLIILSILMFEADQLRGIWQRLLFIIGFGWMICCYYQSKKKIQ